jgi:threonine dehydrogenase-like Zn-dependent dehydrogenase
MKGSFSSAVAPLRLTYSEPPAPPAPGWVRIRPLMAGICGSDLGAITGATSFYFSALVSFPFVPGHEIVAEVLEDAGGFSAGERIVVDPVLGCEARGIDPPCRSCAAGERGLCERVTGGHISPGLQCGYCSDTGGGWSREMVAHGSQLHRVPDGMPDEAAVLVEPLACAIHAVRRAEVPDDAEVLVVGAGTVGLLTLVALREFSAAGRVTVVAKHEHQVELAPRFGATDVVSPREAIGAVRRGTRAFRADPERAAPFLLGGVDLAFDCVGSKSSLDLALRTTKARGRVVMSGMPEGGDLSPAWFRELELRGAYSGSSSFPDAIALASSGEIGKLVGAAYPLERWRDAVDHALSAGSMGATKIVFDPRLDG